MSKSVVDLSADDLDEFAREAWRTAAHEALARGLPVTGSRGGRRFRCHPDGRMEDLGPVGEVNGAKAIAQSNAPAFEMPKTEAAKDDVSTSSPRKSVA
jgi:hypothetical protein